MKTKHHLLIQWPLRLLRGVTMLVLTCFATNQVAPAILMVQAAEKQKTLFAAPKKTDLDLFGDKLVQVEEALDRMARRLKGEHEFEWQAIAHRGGHGPAATAAQRAELRALEDELEADLPRLEGMQGQVRAYFAQVGQHLRDKNTPAEVIARHEEQVTQYETALRQLKDHLHAIKHAKSEAEFKAAVVAADDFMKSHSNKAPRTAFDPTAELAFGPRKSKQLKPAESTAALVKALGLPASADASTTKAKTANAAKAFEAELAATKDAQLSPAIRAKAAELHNNPREIYEFVRNNIQFTPTYGSIQGAEFTLDALRGNAFDQASLLIALLRAANIPSRYVYGTVEAPLAQVQNWVGGTENANATLDVLGQGGIPAIAVTEGGVVKRVKWEHVWVEAHLDYVPSRGEKNRTGDTWIPMDPSFKQYTYTEGLDLTANVGFDLDALNEQALQGATINSEEGWVQNLNQDAVTAQLTDYRSRMQAYVAEHDGDANLGDVLGTQQIAATTLPYLPSALSTKVVAIAQRWAELPDSLRWKFAFETDGSTLISKSLPELAGKRLALSFKAATQQDEQTLANYLPAGSDSIDDLPTSLPAGLINVAAEFSVDGVNVSTGGIYRLGYEVNTVQRLFEPRFGWRETDNTLAAGDYQAVGVDVSGPTSRQTQDILARFSQARDAVNSGSTNGLTKHDYTGIVLQAGIVGYFAQTASKGRAGALGANMLLYRLPSVGTLSTKSTITYWFGLPRRVIPEGVSFDVDRNALISVHKRGDVESWRNFNQAFNHQLSAHEHSVLEELYSNQQHQVHGVSTVKALAVAAEQGQKIYTITSRNLNTALSQINLPADVESDIANAVNAGMKVTTHQADINYAGTVTAGYAIEDPTTGAGAMMISTGDNGGFGMFLLTFILMVAALFAIIAVFASGAWFLGAILLFFWWDAWSDWLNRVSNANNATEFSQANFMGALSALLSLVPLARLGAQAAAAVIWLEAFLNVFEWTWYDDGIP